MSVHDEDLEKDYFRSVVRRIRQRRPVRAIADAYLNGDISAVADVGPLIAAFTQANKHSWRERMVAAWLLGKAGVTLDQRYPAANGLYGVLTQRGTTSLERAIGRCVRFGYLGAALAIGIPSFLSGMFFGGPLQALAWTIGALVGSLFLGVVFAFMLAPIMLPITVSSENRIRAEAARALGRLAYPTAAGALANAVYETSAPVRQCATEALPRVLAVLTPDYYGRAGPYTVQNLCRLLGHHDNRLVLIALNALENVGGGSAIALVERVKRSHGNPTLRERAAAILPILEERRRRETDSQTLLRAAASPELPQELLLRPIEAGSSSDASLLLRVAPEDCEP